jgi:hypothetical protein
MILGFTIAQVAVALVAGVVCVALGVARKPPNDVTLGGLALVELLLVAQIVVAAVAPAVGNPPTGNAIEFWGYLLTALVIPPLAVVWALLERSKWATLVLGVAALAIAIMVWRMHQIWTVQLA